MMMVVCGCSGKNSGAHERKETTIVEQLKNSMLDKEVRRKIDVPVSINVLKIDGDDYDSCEYDDYLSYKTMCETESDMIIEATSRYFNHYTSGNTFYVSPIAATAPISCMTYLNIEVDIVNNTNKRLDIEELEFDVIKSSIDSFPYVYVFTSDDKCDMIVFANESFYNWKGFSFHYSILKKNEVFNGVYKNKQHVDFFEDYYIIDLLDELKEMGFDAKKLFNDTNAVEYYDYDEDCGMRLVCVYAHSKEDSAKYADRFSPFEFKKSQEDERCYEDTEGFPYRGYARLYGKIVFDNTTTEIDFYTDIVLSAPCGGAGIGADDHYDVKLKSQSENYLLRFPYTTVIEPYGTEMVTLSIKAEKSSNHKFYINVKNKNGLNIRTKDVNLHYMAPKHYYFITNTDE